MEKYEEKEVEKMIPIEGKDDMNNNCQAKEGALSPGSPKWMYESPQRKRYEPQ